MSMKEESVLTPEGVELLEGMVVGEVGSGAGGGENGCCAADFLKLAVIASFFIESILALYASRREPRSL